MLYVNFVLQLVFKHIIKYKLHLRGSFIDLVYDFESVRGSFFTKWIDCVDGYNEY